jgi:uncharacterized protein (DUF488 family)
VPVFTIGHSTRSLREFIDLLQASSVRLVVDIRTIPRSRHNPQFNRETLPEVLRAEGIEYAHMPGLGGLRRPLPNSPNGGWRNASFRGFADYMLTPAFAENLEALITRAAGTRIAIMCAEAVPWRCHRSLIADALVVRGVSVEHIMSASRRDVHTLTGWARVDGTRLIYEADAPCPARGGPRKRPSSS